MRGRYVCMHQCTHVQQCMHTCSADWEEVIDEVRLLCRPQSMDAWLEGLYTDPEDS